MFLQPYKTLHYKKYIYTLEASNLLFIDSGYETLILVQDYNITKLYIYIYIYIFRSSLKEPDRHTAQIYNIVKNKDKQLEHPRLYISQ